MSVGPSPVSLYLLPSLRTLTFHANPPCSLGYSVEDRCMLTPFVPHDQREHRGLTLAKRADYFTEKEHYAWPGLLPKIIPRMPEDTKGNKFEIVATAGGTLDKELGVRNIGTFPRERWLQEVAKSKFMVSPPLSPCPHRSYPAVMKGSRPRRTTIRADMPIAGSWQTVSVSFAYVPLHTFTTRPNEREIERG